MGTGLHSIHLVDNTFFTSEQLCFHLNSTNGVLAGIIRHRLFRLKWFNDKVLFHYKQSVHDVDGPWHDFNCVADAPIPLTKDNKPLDLDFLRSMNIPYTIQAFQLLKSRARLKSLTTLFT